MVPELSLRIFTCTNPRRLPGVRCSILKTEKSSPFHLTTMPGRSCVAEIIWGNSSVPEHGCRRAKQGKIAARHNKMRDFTIRPRNKPIRIGGEFIMKNLFLRLKSMKDTRGQDLIEYALMAGFVAVAAGAVMPGVASSISTIFSKVGSVLAVASTQSS